MLWVSKDLFTSVHVQHGKKAKDLTLLGQGGDKLMHSNNLKVAYHGLHGRKGRSSDFLKE